MQTRTHANTHTHTHANTHTHKHAHPTNETFGMHSPHRHKPPGCLTADQATDIHRVATEATHTCANYINILRYLRSDAAMLSTPFRTPTPRRPTASAGPPTAPSSAARPPPSASTPAPVSAAATGVSAAALAREPEEGAASSGARVPPWERVGHLAPAAGDEHDSSECASVIHHDGSSAPTSPPPELHPAGSVEPVHVAVTETRSIDIALSAPEQSAAVYSDANAAHAAATTTTNTTTNTTTTATGTAPVAPESEVAAGGEAQISEPIVVPGQTAAASVVAEPIVPSPDAKPAADVALVMQAEHASPAPVSSAPTDTAASTQLPAPIPTAAFEQARTERALATLADDTAAAPSTQTSTQETVAEMPALVPAPLVRSPDQQSFFSLMPQPFDDEGVFEGTNIRTEAFLNACRGILPVLDLLGPTTFAPVKSDISGNIAKIAARLQADPLQNVTLQNMVRLEMMK
jgi:hypothetical protein